MKFRYPTFEEYLKAEYKGPYVASDVIIRYDDGKKKGIVLIQRKFEPLGLAIPGGMAENMTLEENAAKEAKEETGLDITLDTPNRPLCVFSTPTQDPRAFIASVCYTARGYGELKPHEDEDAKSAEIFTEEELEKLVNKEEVWAFPDHHRKIIRIYLDWRKNGR